MRIAIAILMFFIIALTGPIWFGWILQAIPSDNLAFFAAPIAITIAAAAAAGFWFATQQRDQLPR